MKWLLRCALMIAAIGLGAPARAGVDTQKPHDLQTQALAAYKAGNFADCAKDFAAALVMRPHYPRLLYNLAACAARAGEIKATVDALNDYASMGLVADFAHDADFDGVKDQPAFKAALARIDANRAQVGTSSTVATVTGTPFLAEGIAYDAATQRFFVSSVDQRKIAQVSHDGTVSDFVPSGRDGLLGAFGMAIDPTHRLLWVSATAVAHARDIPPENRLDRGAFAFSLADGHMAHRVVAPTKVQSVIGDLFVDADGKVYAPDSTLPEIDTLPDADIVGPITWSKNDAFVSLQGMTTTPDGTAFVVADYAKGLHFIDRATKAIKTISYAGGTTLLGIDGLLRNGNTLVAVQNGIEPQRIIAMTFDASGRGVSSVKVLSANDPNIPEPSLGTMAGDKYCVVANAQWSRFNDDGTLQPGKALDPPRIACLALK